MGGLVWEVICVFILQIRADFILKHHIFTCTGIRTHKLNGQGDEDS